jgi:hypothetical protein
MQVQAIKVKFLTNDPSSNYNCDDLELQHRLGNIFGFRLLCILYRSLIFPLMSVHPSPLSTRKLEVLPKWMIPHSKALTEARKKWPTSHPYQNWGFWEKEGSIYSVHHMAHQCCKIKFVFLITRRNVFSDWLKWVTWCTYCIPVGIEAMV